MATKFDAIMARRGEIMRKALGMDYSEFELSPIAFDYERMMTAARLQPRRDRRHPDPGRRGQHAAARAAATSPTSCAA